MICAVRPLAGTQRRHAGKGPGHLADEGLLPLVQSGDEAGTVTVGLVARQPIQGHSVTADPIELLQGDLPFGAVDHGLGDARLAAAWAIFGPTLRQEQIGVDQGLVRTFADAEVDRDDTIVDLADAAEVLPLHAGGFASLLDHAGFVDEAHRAETIVGKPDEQLGGMPLEEVANGGAVPVVVTEELLQSSDRGAGLQGDGFDALTGQIGEKSSNVSVEVDKGLGVTAAKQERVQVAGQSGVQGLKFLLSHRDPSQVERDYLGYYGPALKGTYALYC